MKKIHLLLMEEVVRSKALNIIDTLNRLRIAKKSFKGNKNLVLWYEFSV